jgi:hypothetical protein
VVGHRMEEHRSYRHEPDTADEVELVAACLQISGDA